MIKLLRVLSESRKVITGLIWLAVLVVVLAMVGRNLYERTRPTPETRPAVTNVPLAEPDWTKVDGAIAEALQAARTKAEQHASAKLDAWIATLVTRVDSDFLEWYFGYWTQQGIGLKGMWYWTVHKVISSEPDMAERITQDIQEEFSKRVLRPQISQLEIERITREVLELYVTELGSALKTIPNRYSIPYPVWERHLEDLALMANDVEANRSVSLSLKTVATSSTVATVVVVKKLAPAIGKVAGTISGKVAGKATAKIAAKTGTKVAAKGGGKFLGPIVGVGVLVWDAWDHQHTKSVDRPILRQSLVDYFAEMKHSFLHDPETGIATIVRTMEGEVLLQLRL